MARGVSEISWCVTCAVKVLGLDTRVMSQVFVNLTVLWLGWGTGVGAGAGAGAKESWGWGWGWEAGAGGWEWGCSWGCMGMVTRCAEWTAVFQPYAYMTGAGNLARDGRRE